MQMAGARVRRKPNFRWQAAFILLPVVVLAGIGWMSVREDRILVEHDAAERARGIAGDLLPKVWNELTADAIGRSNQLFFKVDATGELVSPPSRAPVPVPRPFNLEELTEKQAGLWLAAQSSPRDGRELRAGIEAWNRFLAANPPSDFAAAAHYGLGLLLARDGACQPAAEQFEWITEKFPDSQGESGLPLAPLAELKLLELVASAPTPLVLQQPVSLDSFASNVVYHPTLLTPELLKCAERLPNNATGRDSVIDRTNLEKWRRVWVRHETERALYRAARESLLTNVQGASLRFLPFETPGAGGGTTELEMAETPPGSERDASKALGPLLFWFSTPDPLSDGVPGRSPGIRDRQWLAVCFDEPAGGRRFVCRAESELGFMATEVVKREPQIPEYFGVGMVLAGRKLTAFAPDLHIWHLVSWYSPKSPGGGERKDYTDETATNILASAVRFERGAEALKVDMYLTSPAALFQRQRTRTFWFGLLVSASAAAALIGLVAGWRAFNRQQQLAEMKSNFVSSVSHELRAPIASVRLMAESLERGKVQEAPRQREYFGFIVQECRRLSSLIENVLDFSRIEQGRKEYEFEPTNLPALMRETVKLMEPYAAE
jgi:hypothetical protein